MYLSAPGYCSVLLTTSRYIYKSQAIILQSANWYRGFPVKGRKTKERRFDFQQISFILTLHPDLQINRDHLQVADKKYLQVYQQTYII